MTNMTYLQFLRLFCTICPDILEKFLCQIKIKSRLLLQHWLPSVIYISIPQTVAARINIVKNDSM